MLRECELVDAGAAERTEEDVATAWRTMDTDRDVWIVEDDRGQIVASAALRLRHPAMADAPPEARVALGHGVQEHNDGARGLLERNGYTHVRRFWRMGIDLDGELPPAEWAEGIRLETMREGGERAVFDAMEEAFQDHWGFVPHRYDEWHAWNVERESFDPSLWFLALDGDEIAGLSQCAIHDRQAWVNVLGVRWPWRRKGLGLALLRHSFQEFLRRGQADVVLEVDSENPTGATGLYERAGMRVLRWSDAYEKVLQEGAETPAASH